ncbi:MAG: hypothetical protein IIB77_13860 [Proteobacteria bacterium]|nr:hypothetical protein [Pseudomonadota bacterium]
MNLSRPMRTVVCLFVVLCWGAVDLSQVQAAEDKQQVDFDRDIRPILSNACYNCHGPDAAQREAELRFDTQAGAFAQRDDAPPAIVPGISTSTLRAERGPSPGNRARSWTTCSISGPETLRDIFAVWIITTDWPCQRQGRTGAYRIRLDPANRQVRVLSNPV